MARADGLILPKPGIPKTLGILNIIFASILILLGGCGLGVYLALPTLLQVAERTVKEAQATQARQQTEQLKALDEREKAATTDAEKATIAQERQAVTSRPKVPIVDYSSFSEMVKNPLIVGYNSAYFGSGLLLCVLLLVAGVALVRLNRAGRSLANAWAVLQIAQIILFAAVSVLYVQPRLMPTFEKMVADLEAKAKDGDAPPQVLQNLQMARAMQQSSASTVSSILVGLVGSIYPVVSLILLNSAGARAALPQDKSRQENEF